MGAIKGTLTYTKYNVENEPPDGFREVLVEELFRHRHREIDVEAGRDQSFGWVVMGCPWSREFTWDKIFMDPYICVSLREDRIRIPTTTLKSMLAEREAKFLEETGRDKLGRKERSSLKDDVLLQLRRRAVPDIRVFDVMWDVHDGTLRMWSQNRGVRDYFEDLVQRSWGIKITPQSPYSQGVRYLEKDNVAEAMLALDPADFVGVEGL